MRVLLVAPRTDLLYVQAETQNVIRSGLEVTPLLGHVTSTQLLSEIQSGSYDVLWFQGHGNSEGIALSDGFLSASELVPQVRERFRLVVINTCDSLQMAQMLQEEGNVDVICTIMEAPDRQAFQTGSLLASALSKSGSISAAYMRSKPGGNRLYLYLASMLPTQAMIEPLLQEIRSLRAEVANMRRSQNMRMSIILVLYLLTTVVLFGIDLGWWILGGG
jgi:hypothetical protein